MIEPLIAAFRGETAPLAAIWALARYDDPRVAAPLTEALENPDDSVRSLAAAKLADLRHRPARDALIAALEGDGAEAVREQAARALGRIGDVSASDALVRALRHDPGPYVREEAAAALGALSSSEAVDALVDALGDRHLAVRRSAADALIAMGPAGVGRLRDVAGRRWGRGRDEARRALTVSRD